MVGLFRPKVKLDRFINKHDTINNTVEGKYWVLVNNHTYIPWVACSENKSIIRFAARCFIKKGYKDNTIYNSSIRSGEYLYDRTHARKYVNSKNIYDRLDN